jgi:hypothetical protein
MHVRDRAQFWCLLLGRSVAEKVAAADFRPGEVLQQVRSAKRRMKLDVKVKGAVVAIVGGRLVQRHDVGKGRLPKVVKTYHRIFQHVSEIACLSVG